MVVGKVTRWSPWASSPPKKRKFEARIAVARLDGLTRPMFGEGDTVTITISSNSPAKAAGGINSYLGRRKKRSGDAAAAAVGESAVGRTGTAEFGFGYVCFGSGSGPWEVSFSVFRGNRDKAKGQNKEKKPEEIGTISVDIGEWLRASQISKKSQDQRQKIAITLEKDGLISEATLYVNLSFVETKKPGKTSESGVIIADNDDDKDKEETSDDSCTLDPDYLDLYKLLVLADDTDKVVEFKSRTGTASTSSSGSGSARSSPDQQNGSVSKHRFLPWGKISKISSRHYDDEDTKSRKTQPSTEPASSNRDEDPIGSWEGVELISRDRQTKLKSQTFFASIDQRDESAGGESACTALVAVIADTLHSKRAYTPTRSEFDALIRQGSSEWRKLCNEASYIDRFPNKHFDLDTILEAKIRPVSVSHENSFVGFFQPESFESLRGAMSFDGIWKEITSDIGSESRVYIVSWNDHFFLLKLDSDAYYIIDTLGERLFEGCTKAYMLKFVESTEMYTLSENSEVDEEELICRGKECCGEFIKRFLAAIPLREELEMEEKGTGNANTALHQRLQIEFHLTEACSHEIAIDDIAHW